MKKCSKCNELKPLNKFLKVKKNRDGYAGYCKACDNLRRQEWAKENPDKIKSYSSKAYAKKREGKDFRERMRKLNEERAEYKKEWRLKNLPRLEKESKERYVRNREDILSIQRTRYQEDKEFRERKKAQSSRYYQNNIEKCKERDRVYYQKNRKRTNGYNLEWQLNRLRTDPIFKFTRNARRRILHAIKTQNTSKAIKFIDLLGCTGEEAYKYLTTKFTDDMTEEAFMQGEIHIDHINPVSSFDLTDPEQQKECFNHTNLQPLWASDNLSKGSKVHKFLQDYREECQSKKE